MGLKHSKPRLRRRMSSRSSKNRLNPEGSPSPAARVGPASVSENKTGCNDACPCRKKLDPHEEQNRSMTSSTPKITSTPNPRQDSSECILSHKDGLKVNLPTESEDSKGETACDVTRVTSQSDPTETENTDITVTLFEAENLNQNEEIRRLMTSIRDVVDTSVKKCQGQRMRVRVSVTPEPRMKNRLRDGCDVTDSLRHTPRSKSEEVKGTSFRSLNSDTARREVMGQDGRTESGDRSSHYRQIPGGNDVQVKDDTEDLSLPLHRRSKKSRSSKPHEPGACCSRQRRHGRGCHNVRSQSGKYQSPFDQSFQDAMFVRLRELQRNSEEQAKIARRAGGDDDVSCSHAQVHDVSGHETPRKSERKNSCEPMQYTNDDSDSEYSGDDDGHVLSCKSVTEPMSRMFEPLSRQAVAAISKPADRTEKRVEGHVEHALALNYLKSPKLDDQRMVHRHYHAPNPTVQNALDNSDVSDENTAEKHWNRTSDKVDPKKRKLRKKKKSPSVGARPHHGYLRASTLPPGSSIPNTPKVTSSTNVTSHERPAGETPNVQTHRHEHFHHHYYYPCKPST
nr:uncharacterized protein LOC100175654 [Ciona intestinalis]|eukprot:XP_002121580.1 uncharacterized protein LOC100175654 [Ciona intestinalis]